MPRLSLGINPFWGTGSGSIALTHAHWPMPYFRSGLLEALLWKRKTQLVKKGLSSHRTNWIEARLDDPFMVDGEVFTPSPGSRVAISCTDPIRFLR